MTIILSFNSLENTDKETISASNFVFIDFFGLSLLHKTPCDFPPKNSQVLFGLPYLLIELFYIGIPVVRTDGHLTKVTTKMSWIHR